MRVFILTCLLLLAVCVAARENLVIYDEHRYTDLYEALQIVGSSGKRGGEYFLMGTFYSKNFGLPLDAEEIIFTSIDPAEPATIVGLNWAAGYKGAQLRYVNLVDDGEDIGQEPIELTFG
jgi:hypothetical protein